MSSVHVHPDYIFSIDAEQTYSLKVSAAIKEHY